MRRLWKASCCTVFWEVKRPGSEAAHSPPSISEVKIEWNCTYTPHCAFMASTGSTLTFTEKQRAVCCSGNSLDLRLGGARFECRLKHKLLWSRYFVVFVSACSNVPSLVPRSSHDCFLPNSCLFINLQSFDDRRYVIKHHDRRIGIRVGCRETWRGVFRDASIS